MANTAAIIVGIICVSLIGIVIIAGLAAGVTLALIFIDFSSENTVNTVGNRSLHFHTAPVIALAINNKQLASGSMNGELFLWNETSWEPRHRIKIAGKINGLKFVDSFSLVSISSDDGLSFWDTESGVEKFAYKNINFGTMNSLLITDEREVIISTSIGYVLVFDRFGEKEKEFTVSGPVLSLHKIANGDLLTNLNTSVRYFKNSEYSFKRIVNIRTGMNSLEVTEPTRGIGEAIVYTLKASLLILDSNGNLVKSITSRDDVVFWKMSQIETGLLAAASLNEVYFFNLATSLEINSIRNIQAEIKSMIADRNTIIIGTSNNIINFYENTHVENDAELSEPNITTLKRVVVKAHNQKVTSLDKSTQDLIVSGSMDNSVAFINSLNAQIVKKLEFKSSIVYVKFANSTNALVVTSKGNISRINLDTFSIDRSVSISQDVTSAELIEENILVGSVTGLILVYDKNNLLKKQEFKAASKQIDVIENLKTQIFASSSENELRIWNSDFTSFGETKDATSKLVAIFRLSNKNLVTIGQDGLIVVWADPSFPRISTSKLSGDNNLITSASKANTGNLYLATKNSIVEYDLFNKIEVSTENIGASEIWILNIERPIIGTENGSIILQINENITTTTEQIQQDISSIKSSWIYTSQAMTTLLTKNENTSESDNDKTSTFTDNWTTENAEDTNNTKGVKSTSENQEIITSSNMNTMKTENEEKRTSETDNKNMTEKIYEKTSVINSEMTREYQEHKTSEIRDTDKTSEIMIKNITVTN